MAKINGKDVVFSPQFHISRPIIFKFHGASGFTLSKDVLSTLSDTIYYSSDKENWVEWDGETTLSSVNNTLYILCDV